MTTYNASVDYSFNTWRDSDTRIRVGVNNVTDERAPLTDTRFSYFSDVHRDLPLSYYVDVSIGF